MKAALLWPADPTSTPPRPAIVGTDAGLSCMPLEVNAAQLPFDWQPVGRTEMGAVLTARTADTDAPLDDPTAWEYTSINTYFLTDESGNHWAARCGYSPHGGQWWVKGTPTLMPDSEVWMRGA